MEQPVSASSSSACTSGDPVPPCSNGSPFSCTRSTSSTTNNRPTLKLPYTERRTFLEGVDLGDSPSKIPPYWTGEAGRDLLTAAADIGAEGVVAKRLESTYQPGRRSPAWVKTPRNRTVEVVIGGWKPGAGSRSGRIGSLLLGMYDDDGRLVYVGNVGTGFTQQMLVQLQQMLESAAAAHHALRHTRAQPGRPRRPLDRARPRR